MEKTGVFQVGNQQDRDDSLHRIVFSIAGLVSETDNGDGVFDLGDCDDLYTRKKFPDEYC
jgi:hypothetical protein